MTKLQRINKAARLIAYAENVSRDVALAWAHQAWAEYETKQRVDAKFAALEKRAAFLRENPHAARPVRTVSKYVGTYEGNPIGAAEWKRRRAKQAREEFPPLVSAEEYFAAKRRREVDERASWRVRRAA